MRLLSMKTLLPRSPLLYGNDTASKRAEIRRYFHSTFDCYELLFTTLKSELAFYQKPISLRHPLIFYYGHTATFFTNKLVLAGLLTERINPEFESMFAIGVDEMSWDDLNDAHYSWPTITQVQDYRNQVRAAVDNIIQTAPLVLPIEWDNPWWVILMGIEHEQIHLETSSVLIRQQALPLVKTHPAFSACPHRGAAPDNYYVPIAANTIHLGKSKQADYYGWDNEYGAQTIEVAAFQAAAYLTSNQEFLAFIDAGGYQLDTYWDSEGLAWRNYTQALHPTFWLKKDNHWYLRLMLEEIPMPWNWPVEVNYHEARAFCQWKAEKTGLAIQLPSEAQWYCLYENAQLTELADNQQANANIHLDYYSSACPVNEFQHGQLFDVIGNVWQWTQTPIYPYSGFTVHKLYDDFTTPTFDNQHNLFKGGSFISCGNEALKSARYAFRRHFFQHAGFRYCISAAPVINPASHYETDSDLAQYAEFHYGAEYFNVPNFAKAVAEFALGFMNNKPKLTALDLGCATGRSSFELARHFNHVTGIDFSARFINLGVQLAKTGTIRYTLTDEGELVFYKEFNLASCGLHEVANKVDFIQGDACNLKSIYTGYDLIIAANLIDRLYNPHKFIHSIHERLHIGGLLVITSPYTWLENHTPRENWLGGFKRDGENVSTLAELKRLLAAHFNLVQSPVDIAFVIRETSHKFQHSLAQATVWERVR